MNSQNSLISFRNLYATLCRSFPIGAAGKVIPESYANLSRTLAFFAVAIWGCHTELFGQVTPSGFQSGQEVVISSDLSNPQQIAIDSLGNLYIADSGNNRVLKETPSADGYSESVVASNGISDPWGVAVDGSGNVYIADSGNGRILMESLVNGAYIESVIVPNGPHRRPSSLAVDSNGLVYVADEYVGFFVESPSSGTYSETFVGFASTGAGIAAAIAVDASGIVYVAAGGRTVKATPSDGSYSIQALGLGVYSPSGIAVDPNGNLFVSNSNGPLEELMRDVPSDTDYWNLTVDQSEASSGGVAVDAQGNVYVADFGRNQIVRDRVSNGDFGTANVGSPSSVQSVIFAYSPVSQNLNLTPAVLTQGVQGMDFADAGTGSCNSVGPGNPVNEFNSCTVDVVFTPTAPGERLGAVELVDGVGIIYATEYVRGTGSAPRVSFQPGALSTLDLNMLASPAAIAVDAVGDLFIAEAVGHGNPANAVVKETWNGSGYTETTVASGLAYPVGVAVDGAGIVYIADRDAESIVRAVPTNGGYQAGTTLAGLGNVEAIAVDGSGNLYIASDALGIVKEFSDNPFGYTQVSVVNSIFPQGLALDAKGRIYLSVNNQILAEYPTSGGYVQSAIISGLNSPSGLAIDAAQNLYIAETGNDRVLKESKFGDTYVQSVLMSTFSSVLGVATDDNADVFAVSAEASAVNEITVSDSPVLRFAGTQVGSTSVDSPQGVTVLNSGTADLTFAVPAQGTNPALPSGFTLNEGATGACPSVDSGSSGPAVLQAGASCNLSISFSPVSTNDGSGWLSLTDNALNQTSPTFAVQSIPLIVSGTRLTPTISWLPPAAITYGTPLSGAELSASSPVDGAFQYSPGLGTVLAAGSQVLSVKFTPSDSAEFAPAQTTATLTVSQAKPNLSWQSPTDIAYGTALDSRQLDAQATVPGTFAYSPAAGSVLSAGSHTLSVTFTPTDQTDYATVTTSVTLTVEAARTTIQWTAPGSIIYGTPLGPDQLNATASVPGTFIYDPPAGTVLTIGTYNLSVTFTPSDAVDYLPAFASAGLQVNPSTPSVSWPAPAPITYGTPLGSDQLDAVASVPGSFAYAPIAGTILSPGVQYLTANFSPTNVGNYSEVVLHTNLTVLQVPQTISFLAPSSLTYGVAPVVLTATSTSGLPVGFTVVSGPANVSGVMLFIQGVGRIVVAAVQPGNTYFQPAPQVTQTITVQRSPQAISFSSPKGPLKYGTSTIKLSASATSKLPVTFSVISGPAAISASILTIRGAGEVTIAASQAGNANYKAAAQVDRSVFVDRAQLTVVANNQSKVYGATHPEFTYSIHGFVEGDAPTVVHGVPTFTTKATAGSAVGSYPIVVTTGTLSAKNYSFDFKDGNLKVEKARLTVTAGNILIKRGNAIPKLSYNVSGFVIGDTQKSVTTGAPKLTTTATSTSPAGTYPIKIALGTLAAKNYSFVFKNGVLTIQ